jgi:hypothetical protein
MTPQHVLNEAFCDSRVVRGCAAVFQHDVIHHPECRHQFRPRSLREQWTRWVGYLYDKDSIWRGILTEPPDMLGQQRIKMASHPMGRLTKQALANIFLRYDFRPRVQES